MRCFVAVVLTSPWRISCAIRAWMSDGIGFESMRMMRTKPVESVICSFAKSSAMSHNAAIAAGSFTFAPMIRVAVAMLIAMFFFVVIDTRLTVMR